MFRILKKYNNNNSKFEFLTQISLFHSALNLKKNSIKGEKNYVCGMLNLHKKLLRIKNNIT